MCNISQVLTLFVKMKRAFGHDDEFDEPQLKKQRPMVSVMREVMGVHCMHKYLPKLEPFLRKVVQEEVGNALCRYAHSVPRMAGNRIEADDNRRYHLRFENSLPHTLFTGSKIEAEGKQPVQISIVDSKSKNKIATGPLSSLKIEILVIDGDFGVDEKLEWTEKEFNNSLVREREGKRPLLTGELAITLHDGVGFLGDVAFTDNSSWIRSRKFRLGARLLQSRCNEVSVREAISGAFYVKDHRGELYKKHHPPALEDEVWRLEKIGKDGAFHKRLTENGIMTVQDFLKTLVINQDKLRSILGNGMSNKIWEATLEHAKECILNEKYYSYCNGHGVMLLLNCIFEPVGAMINHSYYTLDYLSDSQKVVVNKLKQVAYKNPDEIIPLNLPETETLPKSLPVSEFVSLPQSGFPGSHIQYHTAASQDEQNATTSATNQQIATPCNEFFDPLHLKGNFTGQTSNQNEHFGPLQGNNYNIREFHNTGYHGYNSDIDASTSYSPLINTSGSESNGGKWVKIVAALKWMAESKHLSNRGDGVKNLGYPGNVLGEWFEDEG